VCVSGLCVEISKEGEVPGDEDDGSGLLLQQ